MTKDGIKLNEKIAKWCGFKWRGHYKSVSTEAKNVIAPNKESLLQLPRFLCSMDAHIKWTIPKLKELGYMVRVQYGIHYGDDVKPTKEWTGYAHIYDVFHNKERGLRNFEHWGVSNDNGDIGEAMCMALCRAIEKLIDAGEKK